MQPHQQSLVVYQADELLRRLNYKLLTDPSVFSKIISKFQELTFQQKLQFIDLRIRKCYSLLQSNSYPQVKEEIAHIIKFAGSQKMQLPRLQIQDILKRAWISSSDDENIKLFREYGLWKQEQEMLEYKEDESSFKKWIRQWCS